MKIGRNAPCPCGSGKKYKKCCISRPKGATILVTLSDERNKYAKEWASSAEKFESDGHYDWMASFIDGFDTVVEIGAGNGSGTLALAKKGHRVISIDENPECLHLAEKKLKDNDIKVLKVTRGSIQPRQNHYSLEYNRIESDLPEEGVILLEGDTLTDPLLIDWLIKNGSYDAVVCWLIGSHGGRQLNTRIARMGLPNHPGYYRLKVQNHVYELADQILRPGGILHTVDRSEALTNKALENDHIRGHKEQASVTNLEFQGWEARDYTEATDGIKMCVTLPKSGRRPNTKRTQFVTALSVKPNHHE
ncbi:MAG: SEC-C metal-binding domain-containing protein [Bacteroidota bacterium]